MINECCNEIPLSAINRGSESQEKSCRHTRGICCIADTYIDTSNMEIPECELWNLSVVAIVAEVL